MKRTKWLEGRGFKVVRFWNHEVLSNIDGVLNAIFMALQEPEYHAAHPHPNPPPEGEGT